MKVDSGSTSTNNGTPTNNGNESTCTVILARCRILLRQLLRTN